MCAARGIAGVALLTLTGCAVEDVGDHPATADCAGQVRLAGAVYTAYGYTETRGARYAAADEADCQDNGEDVAGSVFPAHPRTVTTWRFPGYSPETVVGVRFDADTLAVFFAESVPAGERDRVLRAFRDQAG